MKEIIGEDELKEKIKEEKKLIIKFDGKWCAPCRAMEPILSEIEKKFSEISIYKIDVDKEENSKILQTFGIMAIPVLFFFKDGEKKGELRGLQSQKIIEEKIVALFE